MLRHVGAAVTVLAFLYGSSAAPYTHAHHAIESVTDEHHPRGGTLVHTHASPHSHHDASHDPPEPAGNEHGDDQIWSVGSFVFHQTAPSHVPSAVLVVLGELHVQPAGIWLSADRLQPQAHGPPAGPPSGLRAPPGLLPVFA